MASTQHTLQHTFNFGSDDSIRAKPKISLSVKSRDRTIVILLIITPIWTILFTSIPVIVKFHGTAADVYRLLEPIVSIPLLYFIMASSEVFIDHTQEGRKFLFGSSEQSFLNAWFLVGAAIYAQGAGMHSTAVMAKHSIEDVLESHPEIAQQYPVLNDVLYYFQETLEHTIGHYFYAAGYVVITWAHLFAYRRQQHDGIDSLKGTIWWITGGILFGLLHGFVAIEFPKGPIVILIYLIIVGTLLGLHLFRTKVLFSKGRRLVLQSYLIGYATAFVIVLIWIAIARGFKNRKEAGFFAH